MQRRIPRRRELAPLIQFKKPRLNPTARRLSDALTIGGLRRNAKRCTAKAAFDYTDGAAEEELSPARRVKRSATSISSVRYRADRVHAVDAHRR
jgi:L-lactate dehydrogenase (cytochrome)